MKMQGFGSHLGQRSRAANVVCVSSNGDQMEGPSPCEDEDIGFQCVLTDASSKSPANPPTQNRLLLIIIWAHRDQNKTTKDPFFMKPTSPVDSHTPRHRRQRPGHPLAVGIGAHSSRGLRSAGLVCARSRHMVQLRRCYSQRQPNYTTC